MSVSGNAINKTAGTPKEEQASASTCSRDQRGLGPGLEKLLGNISRSLGLEGMSRMK